jgi:demethylmenaquinone methyltransferase / 2-methoxy-6-polyprenyl-1,4-benzoquinol methylase
MSRMPTDSDTHFGFRTVPAAEKAGLVRGVFDRVARRYDVMNDLMSAGLHRVWKAALIDWLRPRAGMALIDVAGGTGDIAFRFLDAGGGTVTLCDINPSMLAVGRARAARRGFESRLEWLCGDGEKLPLAAASFDAYTCGFGLRNMTDVPAALAEARRVLKPGGRLIVLEFSHLALPNLAPLYDAYSFRVIPRIGALVARDREAYQYLVESIRRFPDQQRFADMLTAAGFGRVRWRNLAGGVAALHSAWAV